MKTEKPQQQAEKRSKLLQIKDKWWIPVGIIAFIYGIISGMWWIPVLMIIVFLLTFFIYLKKK